MIRLTIPSIEEDDIQAVEGVLKSGYLVQGSHVAAFEQELVNFVQTKHAIAVSNCTAALHLALLALDIRQGDIVLVTAYSYVATANVIELCGATPAFVDIEPGTFNMDSDKLDETLARMMKTGSTSSRIKAIIPVHTFGQMADMKIIMQIANQYGIPVIEDGACALGAKWENRNAGTWASMGCFSFHPRKAITTGEGGAVTTNDDNFAMKIRALRNHGQDPLSPSPDFIMPGFNYRMTDFQAAFGVTQMHKLERIINCRRKLAHSYNTLIENDGVLIPIVSEQSYHVYQSYIVLLPKERAGDRTRIIAELKNLGIETNIGTWHMPMTTYYRTRYGYKTGDFKVTDDVFARSLSLPLYELLKRDEQEFVISSLIRAIK